MPAEVSTATFVASGGADLTLRVYSWPAAAPSTNYDGEPSVHCRAATKRCRGPSSSKVWLRSRTSIRRRSSRSSLIRRSTSSFTTRAKEPPDMRPTTTFGAGSGRRRRTARLLYISSGRRHTLEQGLVSHEDLVGKAAADALAGVAADRAQVSLNDSTAVLWAKSITGKVQRRLVKILIGLGRRERRAKKKRTPRCQLPLLPFAARTGCTSSVQRAGSGARNACSAVRKVPSSAKLGCSSAGRIRCW